MKIRWVCSCLSPYSQLDFDGEIEVSENIKQKEIQELVKEEIINALLGCYSCHFYFNEKWNEVTND